MNLIGTTISHFHVQRKLGAGGMGVVYAAEDTNLGRTVALKFLPDSVTHDEGALKRFAREARAASALNHPNICTVYDIDHHNGQPFLVMELLEGKTLRERIAGTPLPINVLLDFAIGIADALEAAHAHGIIHRDIKSANIFVTERDQAKLLDFGLARNIARGATSDAETITSEVAADQQLTNPGALIGTLAYMAPEQVLGGQADTRSDIFSFGVVLYEMATGKLPFPAETPSGILDAILHRTPARASESNAQAPRLLDEIIKKCLEKNPQERYTSARELLDHLRALKQELQPRQIEPLGRVLRRPKIAIPAAGILIAVLTAGSLMAYRSAKVRWAREQALPKVGQLVDVGDLFSGYTLAVEAERYIPNDPQLSSLMKRVSLTVNIESTPADAYVYRKPYSTPDSPWALYFTAI